MAQVSYGTITINDITDINDVYLEYALALSGANVTNNYTFDNLGEISWSTTYPTWQSGYQIWIREVQEKEGIQQKEYKTPYLDTAVNQINNNYIGLDNKLKTFFYPGDSNYAGAFAVGHVDNLNVNNINTYGFNTRIQVGAISMGYNAIPLLEMGLLGNNFNGIKLYSPILSNQNIITGNRLDATLTSEGLKLIKGGIVAGSYNSTASDEDQNFVYLSSEDYGIGTKIGDSDSNKTDWRQIIGNKFGVDKAGNLYAAGAHIDGDIVAQSLTIGSGANAYSGIAAINISGYSIEIEVADIVGSTETKKLIPHLYHNGMNADSEVTDVTKFLWYIDNNMSVPGAAGLSPDGYIIGEYGHTYKVIYDFGDGVVGSGSDIQTRTVDPSKYITRIDANGITIHPETQNGNSSIRLDGTGLTIYDNNGAYLAKYGSTITLGNSESISNKFNIKITNTTDTEDAWGNRGPGILLRQGKTVLTEMTETGLNIYGDYIDIDDQLTTWTKLASFGAETKIGVNTYTLIHSRGVGFYNTLLEDQPFGLINFYYKVKEDYQQSYSHEWEDYSELNDSYDVDCTIHDNLCTVSGNLEFIIDGDPSSTLHTDSFTYNLSKDDALRTLTYEDTIETEEHNIISYNLVVGVGILSMYGFNPLQCTVGHSASLGENSSLLSYFKINLNINYNTRISGPHYSFGRGCNSIGHYAFAMGNNTIAREDCQLTIGKFNVPTDNALFVIGNGTNDNNRSNLMEVGDSLIKIGKDSQSHIEISSNSFILKDAEQNEYFHISDLRDTNGMASFVREIITDGVHSGWAHPTFSNHTLEVYLEGVLLTQGVDYYDINGSVNFASPPAAGQELKIIVITTSDEAKAFTFGSRSTDSNHFVGAMSIAAGKNVASMGFGAVAEGEDSVAWGDHSHAHGKGTIATFNEEFVVGRYNEIAYQGIGGAFTVGNGSSDSNRSNALTVDWNGNVWAAGAINGLVKHYGAITGATIADKQLTHGTSWQNIGSITLPEGAWLLYLTASFALNGTGYRLLAIADSSAAAGSIIRTNRQAPANGATTSVSINCPLAGGQTYYINGCQNSGTTLKVETRYTAIKIGESFSSY